MKKIYRILDMHCANCAMKLESLEDELEGVLAVQASYHKQLLEVAFDEKVLSEEDLLAAIRELDYTPVPLE